MKCPFCKSSNSIVKDSREIQDGNLIRRRRVCLNCNARFTTFEKIHLRKLLIVKKSGNKRDFDKNKIYKSISIAVRKRNIFDDKINEIVDKIELEIENRNLREIGTTQIGELIMKELKNIDEVAYIRFASVYKNFTNGLDFIKFIEILNKPKK